MIVKVEEFNKSNDGSRVEVLYENGKGLWDGPQRITVHSSKGQISKVFIDMSNYDKHKGKDDEIDQIVSYLSLNLLEGNFTEGNIGNEIEISQNKVQTFKYTFRITDYYLITDLTFDNEDDVWEFWEEIKN